MPTLYEYLGLTIFFYSNEHPPIHVHGEHQGQECKAEIVIEDGTVARINISNVTGRRPLEAARYAILKLLSSIMLTRLCSTGLTSLF